MTSLMEVRHGGYSLRLERFIAELPGQGQSAIDPVGATLPAVAVAASSASGSFWESFRSLFARFEFQALATACLAAAALIGYNQWAPDRPTIATSESPSPHGIAIVAPEKEKKDNQPVF